MHRTVVDPETLHASLDDERWAVIDCRFYLPDPGKGEAEYLERHVPGAVYAHLDRDLSAPPSGTNGRHPLPSHETMVERFSRWGIGDDVQVVVYDTAAGQMAARLWWMLRYLGHERVAVLDGGLASWVEAGLPLRSGQEVRTPRSFTPRPRETMRAGAEELEGWALLDARAPERFRGETEPLDPVAGHIPGAKNHPTSRNLDERGRFLPPDALGERYRALLENVAPDRVVSYCGSGVTACHNLLALEIAGLAGAKLYPGSWSEWCSDPARPTATGPEEG